MSVLEQILREIEKESKQAHEEMRRCASKNPMQFDDAKGYARGTENAAKIIRSHMGEDPDINVGKWIPVTEQLPEKEITGWKKQMMRTFMGGERL